VPVGSPIPASATPATPISGTAVLSYGIAARIAIVAITIYKSANINPAIFFSVFRARDNISFFFIRKLQNNRFICDFCHDIDDFAAKIKAKTDSNRFTTAL
jgi:hypothetical protein